MKRTSQQVTSKSGTPTKVKPKAKRAKYDSKQVEDKIRKWRSASNIASKKPAASSSFVNKLWLNVDKSDPEAVRRVLELHADGKGGDADAVYFSASRFWHTYKILKDEFLSYFLLSLWSVRLEALHISNNSVLIGDQYCALLNFKQTINSQTINNTLQNLDTIKLANWYEIYYNLTLGKISLTDNSEIQRNTVSTFNTSQNSDQMILIDSYDDELSTTAQPPDEQDLELSINRLYDQFDRVRPRFLYIGKTHFEQMYIGDRVVVVLNVLSDVNYPLPIGWSTSPPENELSICVPLAPFEGLGVYQQIALARQFLTLNSEIIPTSRDIGVDTHVFISSVTNSTQTDPQLNIPNDLVSPPLDFDHEFNPTRKYRHNCKCAKCNNFLLEFLQEWAKDYVIITQTEFDNFDSNVEFYKNSQDKITYKHHNNITDSEDCDTNKLIPIEKQRNEGNPGDVFLNFDNNNNFSGGSPNVYSQYISAHTFTESRRTKKNIDLDRLSQSSPEIETSSASSSSSDAQQSYTPKRQEPKYKRAQSPVIIIDEGDEIPTIVTRVPMQTTDTPDIIILDDEGIQPIVKLASSPIFPQHFGGKGREIKTTVGKDTSSYFTPPQVNINPADEYIKQIYFDNVGVSLEKINLELILERTTWGGAHDVLEAARLGQHHKIPTAQAAAAILRLIPIVGSRARGGEVDAVNAVGLIKGRFDDFLRPLLDIHTSTTTSTASVPQSSRSGPTPEPSPAPTTTPDTPSYEPFAATLPSGYTTQGGRAYNRARRIAIGQRGGYNRRRLPRMSGPTTHIGGWYHPPQVAPSYVSEYRQIPGWVPGMPRPPRHQIPAASIRGSVQNYPTQYTQGQPQFMFPPPPQGQLQGPFYFGRGGTYG